MERPASVNISLPASLRRYVKSRVASGGFGNVSEYIRHLLRNDQELAAQRELDALLLEGVASPRVSGGKSFFDERRAKLRRVTKARRA